MQELVLSHENQPGTYRQVREIARETDQDKLNQVSFFSDTTLETNCDFQYQKFITPSILEVF